MKHHQKKGRVIDQIIYQKLKAKRICDECKKKKKILEIHHIIAVSHGGSNEEENLMAVCKKCHEKLDIEQGVRTKESIEEAKNARRNNEQL